MAGQVGFIGLGSMGLGMSTNLLRAGFTVRGFDIDPAKGEAFVRAGGQVSDAAAGAAASTK